MQRAKRLLLVAFVPTMLLLSACSDPSAVSDNNPATPPTTAAATHAATPKPVAKPVAKAKPKAKAAVPYAAATAAGASAVCADGTWSYSKHRSGTCSSHGGVHWWTGNLGAAGPGAH